MGKNVNPVHQYFMEFLGVFFLVLTIQNAAPKVYSNFGIGIVFFTMVFIAAPVSGAHLNPAVTFFCYLGDSSRDPSVQKEKYVYYALYQCLGAIAATIVSYVMGGNVIDLNYAPDITFGMAFLLELIFTAILCFTVGNIGESKTNAAEAGLAVAGVIFIGSVAIGPFTGGVVNPSIGTGLLIGRTIVMGGVNLGLLWLYIFAPLCGAYLAHICHEKYQRPNLKHIEEQKEATIEA